MSEPIECRGLVRTFGRVVALDGVDLMVEPGTLHALLGPSGCGKTTLLRTIAGFERPDRGEVRIAKALVCGSGRWVPPERRGVGMVFQDYALFPHLTVAENVAFGLRSADSATRVGSLLETVGLSAHRMRLPHELSGGEQQRVALARALAPRPKAVLLDEPFSNLDARLRHQLRGEVRDILQAEGVTAVFVTHDQSEAFAIGDRISLIFSGRVAQSGSPSDVYERPRSLEVADFVGRTNLLPGVAHGRTAGSVVGELPLQEEAEGAVTLVVRPEQIVLGDAAPCAGPEGTVTQVVYLGDRAEISLSLSQTTLVASVSFPQPRPRVGETVRLAVRGAVCALPAAAPHDGG